MRHTLDMVYMIILQNSNYQFWQYSNHTPLVGPIRFLFYFIDTIWIIKLCVADYCEWIENSYGAECH